MQGRHMRTILVVAFAFFTIAANSLGDEKGSDDVVFETGIVYSNPEGEPLALNLARPKGDEKSRPAVVCIHGGGFRAGTREHHDGLCKQLAARGYVAVTVTYRLAPKHQFPAAVHDVKAAVRWLRANADKYGVDPDRIGAMGDSAGGHLALFLGMTGDVKMFDDAGGGNADQSSKVQCVVDIYGPSDLTRSYGKSVDAAEVLPLFFGGDLKTKRREHVVGSPLNWVSPHAPPTLAIHGTKDPYVAYEQSVWLVDRLLGMEVESSLFTLEGAGHGFKGEDAERAQAAMLAFFDKHLKKEK
ncbi:MAG: alpha/beta hydrolase [Planctomycetota bacterium]